MTDNPSAGESVTPTPTTPVIGTPAQSGVTPATTPTLSHEDAMKRLADLERSLNNAKEENDRHSKRLSTYEKQEKERIAAEQALKDAQLSEIERVKKQHADAEARIKQQQQQLVLSHIRELAKEKGIINPKLIAPVVERELEYDKDGEPTNIEKVLDDLIKNNPYLVPKPAEPATPPAQTAPTQTAPAVPVNHPSRSGRSDIPSAAGATPGRIPGWNEVFKRP